MMENISSIFIFHVHFHLKELLTSATGSGVPLSWISIAGTVKTLPLSVREGRKDYFVTTLNIYACNLSGN